MPCNLLIGEDMSTINLSAVLIDLLAVNTRAAHARLQVQAHTSQIGEFVGAPGTFDVSPLVNGGFKMLSRRRTVSKSSGGTIMSMQGKAAPC